MDEFSNEIIAASRNPSEIKDTRLFRLAGWMLGCIFVFCACIFYFYASYPDNAALKEMFEFVKVSIMPLVVLIVSFYFKNN